MVHDDTEFATDVVAGLRQAAYDVMAFADSHSALDAMEAARTVELVITPVQFPPGQPNGVSLGLMARNKRRGVKILFLARPENEGFADGIGEVLVAPVTANDVVAKAQEILSESPDRA